MRARFTGISARRAWKRPKRTSAMPPSGEWNRSSAATTLFLWVAWASTLAVDERRRTRACVHAHATHSFTVVGLRVDGATLVQRAADSHDVRPMIDPTP